MFFLRPHSYELGMPGFSTHMGWGGWIDLGQWSRSLPSLQLWVSSLRRIQSQSHLARCVVVPLVCADLHLVLCWLIYMLYLSNASDQQLNWWKWSRNWLLLRVKCFDDKGMFLEFMERQYHWYNVTMKQWKPWIMSHVDDFLEVIWSHDGNPWNTEKH